MIQSRLSREPRPRTRSRRSARTDERQRQEMAAKVAQLNERIRDLNQKLLGTSGAAAALQTGTPQGFFKR